MMKRAEFLVLATLLFAPIAQADQVCNDSIKPTTPTADFTDNLDGTVTHHKTGLMWKVCMEGRSGPGCVDVADTYYDWHEALELADGHSFAGYSDWRLPNLKELSSIAELRCYQPAINLSVFPNTPSARFWSGSPDSSTFFAWFVLFTTGTADTQDRNNIYTHAEVRLVRDGN